MRDLHARSWARVGVPVVKEYQQEYFTRIGVILDTSTKIVSEARFEAAISLTAGVVARITRNEALIDMLVVGESVQTLTMGRSLGFLDQALDLLACVSPSRALTPSELETRLSPYITKLSHVILISSDWAPSRQSIVDWIERQGVG